MQLHAQTLFLSMFINVSLMSLALALGVRSKARSGIRAWNAALMLQALGWVGLMLSYALWPKLSSTLGVVALHASASCIYLAVAAYVDHRAQRLWVYGVPALVGLLHWAAYDSFVTRVAVVNGAMAAQMVWPAWLLVRRQSVQLGARWRWLAATALAASGAMVFGRMAMVLLALDDYPQFDAPHWINIYGLIVNNAGLTIGTLAILLAHRDEAEQELQRLASTDGLTGTLNRRSFMEQGEQHRQLALRHGWPLTVMMIDLDWFKRINDQRGHQAGDQVLVAFAQALQKQLRQPDRVGRYGGEEFCALLPMSGAQAALAIDARLRAALSREAWPTLGFEFTFSAGVAELGDQDLSLDTLIARADSALYAAKQAGRNRLLQAAAPVRRVQAEWSAVVSGSDRVTGTP